MRLLLIVFRDARGVIRGFGCGYDSAREVIERQARDTLNHYVRERIAVDGWTAADTSAFRREEKFIS